MEPRAQDSDQSRSQQSSLPLRAVAWFLALSYALGAPLVAVLEYRESVFSERFGLPAWLIYGTVAIQIACVPLVLSRRHARNATVALSVITVGAVLAHFRIGSPLTAFPALFYTAVQVWFGTRGRVRDAGSAV